MVLSSCNTYASIDVESAISKFKEFFLSKLPGEDVSLFSTLALKYIKVMQGKIYLSPSLATDLLLIFQDTKIEIFEHIVIDHYIVADLVCLEISNFDDCGIMI